MFLLSPSMGVRLPTGSFSTVAKPFLGSLVCLNQQNKPLFTTVRLQSPSQPYSISYYLQASCKNLNFVRWGDRWSVVDSEVKVWNYATHFHRSTFCIMCSLVTPIVWCYVWKCQLSTGTQRPVTIGSNRWFTHTWHSANKRNEEV